MSPTDKILSTARQNKPIVKVKKIKIYAEGSIKFCISFIGSCDEQQYRSKNQFRGLKLKVSAE